MSWDMWHVEGFGFRTDAIDIDHFKSFCQKHETQFEKYDKAESVKNVITDYLSDGYDHDDWDPLDEIRQCTERYALSEIIAFIIRKENPLISFEDIGISDESEEAVMFLPCMPWEMTPTEEKLTQDHLMNIINKYADELGVPANTDYRGYLDLTFSG